MRIPSFILQKTNISSEKIWHFYLSAALWIAAYTLFAYSVVIFLNERLESELWVGVFLSIGSMIAIVLDIPFGFLQKMFSPRSLLSTATFGMMITVGIFLFAHEQILWIFGAAVLYGISHDLYDVTMFSYIFNHSLPAQYGQNISQRSVAEALGILFGLIFSGVLLFYGSFVAQIGLEVLLAITLVLILMIFDRDQEASFPSTETELKETLTHQAQELTANTTKGLKVSAINIIDLTQNSLEVIKQSLDKGKIILKPLQPGQESMIGKIWQELKKNVLDLGNIVMGEKLNWPLIWSIMVLLLFSFWDTFVITFEPLFLTKFLAESEFPRFITGGVIMTLFLLPLFFLLVPISKLADKYGRPLFIIGGVCTSGISLYFFGQTQDLLMLILFGMLNSVGYAAVMPSVQAMFAEKYNEQIAISEQRTEIDSNSSAAPLKMLVNLGNVVGQAMGGILIASFGFNIFFLIFAFLLVTVAIFSFGLYPILRKPPYILDQTGEILEV